MSYKSYPAYKNSGNEWLGEIPEGWDIYRLKETTKKIPFAIVDGPFGSMLKADEYQEEGVPLVRITNLSYSGDFSSEDLVYISDLKAAELSRSTVKYGDIVIGKTGATIGKFAPYPNQQPGVLASSCIKITFSDALIELAFIRYIFMSKPFQEELIETSGGSTRDTINIGPFGNLHIFLPPLSTQKAIAAFLDAKTACIDGLVRDYVELVSLLKEKRQALVSHAVTRGLSELVGPDDTEFGEWARPIAFKNSGVEWLGEIPEGWEIYQLRRDLDFVTSGSRGWAAYYSEEGALFLRIGNLSRKILRSSLMISKEY
jgi:type I restriction enzyme S subunit